MPPKEILCHEERIGGAAPEARATARGEYVNVCNTEEAMGPSRLIAVLRDGNGTK